MNKRLCSNCGKYMSRGYVIENGFEYYCSDNCLHKHYTENEYLEMYDDGDGDSYYTEWESEMLKMNYDYERVENMIFSINKNIQELSELCLEYNISNAYILMDVIENYYSIVGYLKQQNKGGNLCGLHDRILEKIGE